MNVLEKILGEIEELKRNQDSKNQDFVTGYISALSTVEGVIAGLDEAKDINVPSNDGWIPVEERLPEDCEEIVLVQVSGKPADNILFDNAFEFALYEKEEGWMLDNYPEWKNSDVIAWQSLPKPYRQPKKEKSSCKEHIMSRFMKVE